MQSMFTCATNLRLAAMLVASQLLALPLVALGVTHAAEHGSGRRLWDESRQLSSHERADLDSQLKIADHRLGSPVFVLIVEKLHHDSAAALGARTFAERVLGGGTGSDPILLVVSLKDRVAAIETGKGNAGIIPEIDARRITKDLASRMSASSPAPLLQRALVAIVDSAEATAARRRPLPRDPVPLDPPADIAAGQGPAVDAAVAGSDAPGDAGTPNASEKPLVAPKPASGSKLPLAAAICGLLLLALSVRRRRQIAADRRDRSSTNPKPPSRPSR